MQTVDVSVIIVTYNSAGCIADCVKSVLGQSGVSSEVIVVDNASSDGTLAKLKELNCRVIPSPENLGFGRGCNLGFAASSGRYIYLLNPDARLTANHSLAELVRQMDANSQWGIAGTRVLSADGHDENLSATEYPGQRRVRRDFSKLPGKIAWILGASMVVRRDIYEQSGGFDPGFFLYSEETDFCLRLRELGHEIGMIPDVVVSHIGGASEDRRDPYQVSARKLKGLLRFRQKHYAPEDCLALAKYDRRRSWFRMIWNRWLARWQPPGSMAWQKYRRYRGVWEASKDFLEQKNPGDL